MPPAMFDLDAYLARIGLDGPREPTLATLRAIVGGHSGAIAFENLDPFTGRSVVLDVPALEAKLVRGGRGGYCFEQNGLLIAALDALGYTTTGLAARVVWNQAPDAPVPARGHMLVRVDLDEGPHLVDVGFGGLTLTGVLRLEPEAVQETPHEPFRLLPGPDGDLVMQALIGERWANLYRFGLQRHYPADYAVTSWYLSNNPESHFVTGLMAARPAADRRYALRGNELTVHHLGGGPERRTLGSVGEIRAVLEENFLLDMSGLPDADAQLGRLL
jgi:arylamine N-acetyltransferase